MTAATPLDAPADVEVAALSALPTAAISDALDRLGLPGSALGIHPLFDGARAAGRAFTVGYGPINPVSPGNVGDYIDDVAPGQIVVLDNQGRADCTVWGDILTSVSSAKGVAGTVISGVCRDTARALELGYPIFSVGRFMRTGKDRVEVVSVGAPANIGGVQVRPGDILVGDSDGVVAVPATRAAEVADLARRISDIEDKILAEALSSGSLRAARAKHGYHQLQGRSS